MGGFFVDSDSVRGLAAQFETAADELSGRVAVFAERAQLRTDAFGRLPSGDTARAQYAVKLENALDSLGQLQRTLSQFATNLQVTVDNYQSADGGGSPESTGP